MSVLPHHVKTKVFVKIRSMDTNVSVKLVSLGRTAPFCLIVAVKLHARMMDHVPVFIMIINANAIKAGLVEIVRFLCTLLADSKNVRMTLVDMAPLVTCKLGKRSAIALLDTLDDIAKLILTIV